jgi:UDPglucose 6-dehydrogenase
MRVLQAVEEVNEAQKSVLYNKVLKHYQGDIKGKKFAVWGLSFKPKTDDMREAPSVVIINQLLGDGATVVAYDPVAVEECKKHHLGDRIAYADDQYEALAGADALLVVTEWPEFRTPDWDKINGALKARVMFDGRNIYETSEMKASGYQYYCIGIQAK